MDISGGSVGGTGYDYYGRRVQLWTCNGWDNQLWYQGLGYFPGGAWLVELVELAELADPALIAHAVIAALDLRDRTGWSRHPKCG